MFQPRNGLGEGVHLSVLCPAGLSCPRPPVQLDLGPQAGGRLTCVEDTVRAATWGGVNQLRDGERQSLKRGGVPGRSESRETHSLFMKYS